MSLEWAELIRQIWYVYIGTLLVGLLFIMLYIIFWSDRD